MNYENDTVWKQVQDYLPEDYRITAATKPEEYFLPIGNCNLHIDHYKVPNPKAIVIMFHGVGGNGRLLSCIAVALQRNGFEVVCPDLPLYGYTEFSSKIDYQTWVDCGKDIVRHYQKEDSYKLFIFGLSAGGMLAYQVACESHGVSGILVSCILDQRNMEITKQTAITPLIATIGKPLMRISQQVIGNLKVPMKFIGNMKAIANNANLAKLLMRDKKSSGVSVPIRFIYSMMTPKITVEPEQFQSCPFLLIHPGEDRWTDLSLSKLFFDRLACEKEIIILEGAGHFPVEEAGLSQLERECTLFLSQSLSSIS